MRCDAGCSLLLVMLYMTGNRRDHVKFDVEKLIHHVFGLTIESRFVESSNIFRYYF